MEIKLTKSIKAHGKDVAVLELREPTGPDVRRVGALPFDVRGETGQMIQQPRVALKYAAICADVPPSSLDQLSAGDVLRVVNEIVRMFTGSEKTSIRLREPSGRESRVIGALPFLVALDGESISINTGAAMRYIAMLSEMEDAQVDELPVAELSTLFWDVAHFFFDGVSTTSTS